MTHDALEVLTERVSALVRQFGLDSSRHGFSDDRAVARRVGALMAAVRNLQALVEERREDRATGPDPAD